jgi:hypothetical protein
VNDPDDIEVVDLRQLVDTIPRQRELLPPSELNDRPRGAARHRARRPWLRALVGGLAVFGIGWAVLAVVSLVSLRADVPGTRDALLDARAVLNDGDVGSATDLFDAAAGDLQDIADRVSSPVVAPVRLIPHYRRTLDAVGDLGRAGGLAASAAAKVTSALAEGEGGLGALTPRDGRIPVQRIAELGPVLEAASADVVTALEMARAVPATGVDEAVAEGRAEFIDIMEPTAEQLALGVEITQVLPAVFGADEPRRYVVMASNPTEARGTGGFFGAYVVMDAVEGELSFGRVGETLDLPVPADGSVVEWVDPSLQERWEIYGGSTRIRSINMTPDFPSAATMIERYWAAVLGEEVDGVIAVDPYAFEAMLEVNGPIELPGLGEIGSEDVVEFVSYSAYSLIGNPIERKRLIGNVAASTLQGFLDGPGDVTPSDVLDALGRMARRDSLLIHSARPAEQALLERTGLAGELDHGDGDMLAVILNSGSGSKIDYFLDRTVRYDVTMGDGGRVDTIIRAGFVNNAPASGELAYMIGPPDTPVDFVAGDNVGYVSVYGAPGTTFHEIPDIGYGDYETTESVELGYPVASTWMLIPSMRSRELIYSATTPEAWEQDGEDRVYRLRYVHQVTVRSTELQVQIRIPDGFEPVDLPEDVAVADGHVTIVEQPRSDLDLEVRFRPAGP